MRYAKKLRTVCTGLLSPTTKGLPLVPVLFLAAGCNLTQAPPPPSVDLRVRLEDFFGSLQPDVENPCELQGNWQAIVVKILDAPDSIVEVRAAVPSEPEFDFQSPGAGGICFAEALFPSLPLGDIRVVATAGSIFDGGGDIVRVCEQTLTDQGSGFYQMRFQNFGSGSEGCSFNFEPQPEG